MREIAIGDPLSQLKKPNQYDPSFIDFLKSCLVRDSKSRLSAEDILKTNKKFFSLVKDKKYIKDNLLSGVPTVQERVKINLPYLFLIYFSLFYYFLKKFKLFFFQFDKGISYIPIEPEEKDNNENFVNWNFDIQEIDSTNEINETDEKPNMSDSVSNTTSQYNKDKYETKTKTNGTAYIDKFKGMFSEDEAQLLNGL